MKFTYVLLFFSLTLNSFLLGSTITSSDPAAFSSALPSKGNQIATYNNSLENWLASHELGKQFLHEKQPKFPIGKEEFDKPGGNVFDNYKEFYAKKTNPGSGVADAKLVAEHEQLKRAVTSVTDVLANSYSSSPTTHSPSSFSENVNTEEMARKLQEAATLKQAENERLAKEKADLQQRFDRHLKVIESSGDSARAEAAKVNGLIAGLSTNVGATGNSSQDAVGLFMQGFAVMIQKIQADQSLAAQIKINSDTVNAAVVESVKMLSESWAEAELKKNGAAASSDDQLKALLSKTKQTEMLVSPEMVSKAFDLLGSHEQIIRQLLPDVPLFRSEDMGKSKFILKGTVQEYSQMLTLYISEKLAEMPNVDDPLDLCKLACDEMSNFISQLQNRALIPRSSGELANSKIKEASLGIDSVIQDQKIKLAARFRGDFDVVNSGMRDMATQDLDKLPVFLIFMKYGSLALFYLQEAYTNPKDDVNKKREISLERALNSFSGEKQYLSESQLKALYVYIFEGMEKFDTLLGDVSKKFPVPVVIKKNDFEIFLKNIKTKLTEIDRLKDQEQYQEPPKLQRTVESSQSIARLTSELDRMVSGRWYREVQQDKFSAKISNARNVLKDLHSYTIDDLKKVIEKINELLLNERQKKASDLNARDKYDSKIKDFEADIVAINKFLDLLKLVDSFGDMRYFLDTITTEKLEEYNKHFEQFAYSKLSLSFLAAVAKLPAPSENVVERKIGKILRIRPSIESSQRRISAKTQEAKEKLEAFGGFTLDNLKALKQKINTQLTLEQKKLVFDAKNEDGKRFTRKEVEQATAVEKDLSKDLLTIDKLVELFTYVDSLGDLDQFLKQKDPETLETASIHLESFGSYDFSPSFKKQFAASAVKAKPVIVAKLKEIPLPVGTQVNHMDAIKNGKLISDFKKTLQDDDMKMFDICNYLQKIDWMQKGKKPYENFAAAKAVLDAANADLASKSAVALGVGNNSDGGAATAVTSGGSVSQLSAVAVQQAAANQLPKANTLADLARFGYTDIVDESILDDQEKFKAHKESYVKALKQTSNGAKFLSQNAVNGNTQEKEMLDASKAKFKLTKAIFLRF